MKTKSKGSCAAFFIECGNPVKKCFWIKYRSFNRALPCFPVLGWPWSLVTCIPVPACHAGVADVGICRLPLLDNIIRCIAGFTPCIKILRLMPPPTILMLLLLPLTLLDIRLLWDLGFGLAAVAGVAAADYDGEQLDLADCSEIVCVYLFGLAAPLVVYVRDITGSCSRRLLRLVLMNKLTPSAGLVIWLPRGSSWKPALRSRACVLPASRASYCAY